MKPKFKYESCFEGLFSSVWSYEGNASKSIVALQCRGFRPVVAVLKIFSRGGMGTGVNAKGNSCNTNISLV